jgi:hypothetical protein
MKLNVYPEMPGYLDATVIPTGNEDHRYYLRRRMLLNESFLPITTFRGMAPPQDEQGERLPCLSINQGCNNGISRVVDYHSKEIRACRKDQV